MIARRAAKGWAIGQGIICFATVCVPGITDEGSFVPYLKFPMILDVFWLPVVRCRDRLSTKKVSR